MKGRLRLIRRVFAIMCTLVLLSTGTFSAFADYEERTESTEEAFETGVVSDGMDQETELSKECGDKFPGEEKIGQTDKSGQDADSEDKSNAGVTESPEKSDLPEKLEKPGKRTDSEDEANEGATERTEESDLPEKLEKPGELEDSEDETYGGVTELAEESNPAEKQEESGELADSEDEDDDTVMSSKSRDDITSEEVILQNGGSQSEKYNASEEQKSPEETINPESGKENIEMDQGEAENKPAEEDQQFEKTDKQEDAELVDNITDTEEYSSKRSMLLVSKSNDYDIAEDAEENSEESQPREAALRGIKGNAGYTVAVSFPGNPIFQNKSFYILAKIGNEEYKASMTGNIDPVYFGAMDQLPGKPESIAIVDGNNMPLYEINSTAGIYYIISAPILDETNHKYTLSGYVRQNCGICFSSAAGMEMPDTYYIVAKRKGSGRAVAYVQIKNGEAGKVTGRLYNDSTFVIIKTNEFYIDYYNSNPKGYPEYIEKPGSIGESNVVFSWDGEPFNGSYYIYAKPKKDVETEERVDENITVKTKDQNGAELSGLTFGLYQGQECTEETKIAVYSEQSFEISTGFDVLANYLPTMAGLDNATILYLKQIEAPAGYDVDTEIHPVVITRTIRKDLDEESNTYVTTTTYGITIDGKSAIDITNAKRTKEERVDGSVTITIKDQNGAELSGLTFGLYQTQDCVDDSEITTYSGQNFGISTGSDELKSCLPTVMGADNAKILYLKQIEALAGFDADTTVYSVVITKSEATELNEGLNTYVTTTTYGITIDGKSAIDITNAKRTKEERVDGSVTITTKDQNGTALSGLTFGLYPAQECTEGTQIATYTGQSIVISTNLDVLAICMPTVTGAENATTLYLKQIEAPAGYDADTEAHPVIITRSVGTELNEGLNTYVTMTAYGMTIDGKNGIDITNAKRTKEERVDGSITITTKDQDGLPLSGLAFGLYPAQECTEGTKIATYTGQSIVIDTGLEALTSCLPIMTGAEYATTLYLKQMETLAGYDVDTEIYPVIITKAVRTDFAEETNTYVTMTTYGITIDGKSAIDITNAKRTKEERVDGSVTITTKDQDGADLSGSSFGLYRGQECTEGTEIAIYSGQNFEIRTNLDTLAIYLPIMEGVVNATTLYLKQTTVPAGYDADTTVHAVVIIKSEGTELNIGLNTYVTTITYEITIDGKNRIDITNTKRIKEERTDGSITITPKDQEGTSLSGLTFGLYPTQECVEDTEIAIYSGQSIVISTNLDALARYLPTMTGIVNATTLYLKQTTVPAGYDADTTVHAIVIIKSVETGLNERLNTYVTTITYGITIDGESETDITNTKRTKEERTDRSITITTKDQDGAALSGSSFGVYREQECIEGTELAIYSGQYFEIRTNLDALASYLPTMMGADNTMTLYLKQIEASAGYHVDMEKHPVVITKTIRTDLDEETNTYVTTTTYGITIDGKNEIDITNAKQTKEERTDGSITITTKDQDGADLSGLSFGLYHTQDCTEGTKIATYSGQGIVIRTNFDALASYLPTATGADNATTLYLKQMKAPAGYDEDMEIYPVVIMKTVRTELDEGLNTYVTMTTYGITIDDNSTIDIVNTKRTKEERTDGSITIIAKDQNGAELSGLTFGLYQMQDCVDDSEITTYSGKSIVISTNMDVLASYMPTVMGADNATTLYLKQIEAPAGYNADTIVHPVVITKYVGTELNEGLNTYVTTTTYGIAIEGKSTIDITNAKRTKEERIDRSATITTKDQDGTELSGTTLGLYQGQECIEGTKIATYSERSFEISTGSDALASCLPTITGVDNATVLYLKQIEAPAGYDVDTEMHTVVITKTIRTDLDEESNTYVTTIAYGITIDGKTAIDIVNTKRTKEERVDENIIIATKDQDGTPLSGLTFGLYPTQECVDNSEITTYTGQSFGISTGLDALASYLPTATGADNATTLYLKQMEAPVGYDEATEIHPVVITKAVGTDLDEESNTYVTTITYGITIDGESETDITNTKRTKEERIDGSITITTKDQDGTPLSGLTFGLYPAQECTEGTQIATYTGQSIVISTNLDALASYLPTMTGIVNATTLYLKQTTMPAGYDADTTLLHSVVIIKSVGTEINEGLNTYVTTTTYGMTIDGKNGIDITNTKRTKEERADENIMITTKDQDGTPLSGLTVGLYPAQECTEGTQIATYTGQSILIGTGSEALTSCLPTMTGAEYATILYLKQIEAPVGYDEETEIHQVVITKTVRTDLDEESNMYVTTTTYGITIDGKSTIDITNAKRTKEERIDGNVTITIKDQNGVELNGSTFGLYQGQECTEGTELATYGGQNFEIRTNLDALASYLPTMTGADNATTLYLKQMKAPAGYNADTAVHPVIITKSVMIELDKESDMYVTTTTYEITIDGKSAINITNTIRAREERKDGSITITAKDQNGAELSGLSFGLYQTQICTEETEIATYSGQSFEITTGSDALESSLPTTAGADNATILYLKQVTVQADYDIDTELHSVDITKEETTYFEAATNTYITKITYEIRVDGESEITITNKKHIDGNDEGNTMNPKDEDNITGEENGYFATDGESEGATIDENGNDTTIEGDGNTKTSEGNGDIVTNGEGEGAAIGENGNATIVEGDGNTATAKEDESSIAPKESGNIMSDGEDEGAVANENGNNPDGEVNGNLITFEGNVGISTGEANEKSATSEENVDITTGEKDEVTVTGDSPKNATGENKDNSTAIGEAGKNVSGGKTEGNTNIGEDRYSIISDGHEIVSKLEKGEDEANKKPDQTEKGPDKTGINTNTGNASAGLDEKTEQTIQAEAADTSFDTDTESQTSKTGQLKKKQNVNKPKVSDGKNKVPAIEQIKGNTEIEMVLQDIISIMNSENPLSFLPDEALAEITSAYSKVLDVQTVELVNYDASMGAVDLVLQTKEKITKETEVRAVFILPGTSVNQHFVVDGIGQEDGTVKVTLDAVMAAELVNKQFISMTLGKQD